MTDIINFDKLNGIVPAIVQDANDGTVLMLGFMNREALLRTIEEGEIVFWSRTKNRLWKKGETSGNYLRVVSVCTDCDNDALLITAQPSGPVCHTGARSCFSAEPLPGLPRLYQLWMTIKDRKQHRPAGSYTTELFASGMPRIAQKVGEEAVELAIAAQHPDPRRIIEETADLVYHVLVLLAEKGIEVGEIADELERRKGKGNTR